jgi:hypothetical protein
MSVKAAIAAIGTKKANLPAPEVIYIRAEVSISLARRNIIDGQRVPAGKTLSLINAATGKQLNNGNYMEHPRFKTTR